MKALLALEDGTVFECRSFTGSGQAEGEIVFVSAMTGYQEILTNPSFAEKIIVMTYPLVGSYGVCDEDMESWKVQASGVIVREYQDFVSNFRSQESLKDLLQKSAVLGVEGLDTRALTRHLSQNGWVRAVLSTLDLEATSLIEKAKNLPSVKGQNLAVKLSTDTPFFFQDGQRKYQKITEFSPQIWQEKKPHIVLVDYGVSFSDLCGLCDLGFELLVLPSTVGAKDILALQPSGIVLSAGPGDPLAMTAELASVCEMLGQKPIFGIGLGMQLLGLALGGTIVEQKTIRGGSQPIKDLASSRVEMVFQNHRFRLADDFVEKTDSRITHIHLNQKTIEGFVNARKYAFGVQFEPGRDFRADFCFSQFCKVMNYA